MKKIKMTIERKLIATLYLALTKECWEKGPTQSEAEEAAHNWFWNLYDEAGGDPAMTTASDGIRAMLAPRRSKKKEAKRG